MNSVRPLQQRQLIDIAAAADYLATTERHVRALVERDAVPYFKVGRRVRFDVDDLDRWLHAHRRGAVVEA